VLPLGFHAQLPRFRFPMVGMIRQPALFFKKKP